MNCDWLSKTIVISVYDSFFGNYISMILFSYAANHNVASLLRGWIVKEIYLTIHAASNFIQSQHLAVYVN